MAKKKDNNKKDNKDLDNRYLNKNKHMHYGRCSICDKQTQIWNDGDVCVNCAQTVDHDNIK